MVKIFKTLQFLSTKAIVVTLVLLVVGQGIAQGGEVITFYHNDHLGSPLAMTDMAGNPVWQRDYKPFGEEIEHGVNTSTNTHSYTGKEFDAETGLYYFGARYYEPKIGRFISVDPVVGAAANPQSWNRYVYALNNPYSYIDPDGRLTLFVHGTWSDPKVFTEGYMAHVASDLGEKYQTDSFDWTPAKNNKKARSIGAKKLSALINSYEFSEGEKLNIVSHSHGSNLVIESLSGIERKVDNLYLLGGPVRHDYRIGEGEADNVVNAYNRWDMIQIFGGSIKRLGLAGRKRTENGVTNIAVKGMGFGVKTHSRITRTEAWDRIREKERK